VTWNVRASKIAQAKFLAKALTDEESDALELDVPVEPWGLHLNSAQSGAMRNDKEEIKRSMVLPQDVNPDASTLRIDLAPSIAGTLMSALDFLASYPYGCVEQTMSSFLPNILVTKAVKDLGLTPPPASAELDQKIAAGLQRLYMFQHDDGGWGWWQTDETHPFMTAYVVAGLSQARDNGVGVHFEAIENGVKWLEQDLNSDKDLDPDLRAYIAYALALSGRSDPGTVEQAYDRRSKMTGYGLAVLGLALDQLKDKRAAEIAAVVEAKAQQDQDQAWWPSMRDPMLDFDSDTTPEATAFATKLLARQGRGAALLPKAAQWLMNHRNEGYWWSSTKQTAMVIYGLTDYLRTTNELKPNLTATVYVNGKAVLTKKIDSATALNQPEVKLDDSQLDPGVNHIRVEMSGDGRLYYSTRSEYYSADAKLEKTGTISLNLLRDYFRLSPTRTGDKIVYDTTPLTGASQPGDIVAVRLTVTGSEWKYLMIEDPIPAGAEFISTDNLYEIRNRPPWWNYEFTRRELHDDRMAIFQTYFSKGQQQYFYLLRIVNPGKFQISPARVGPMYQPDVAATTESRMIEVQGSR
jgi:hypothetical protein